MFFIKPKGSLGPVPARVAEFVRKSPRPMVLMTTLDIMNNTEAVLDIVEDMVRDSESHGSTIEDTGPVGQAEGAGDAPVAVVPFTQCNDGERAILSGYVSLVRQCIELAEKVGAAKA